MRTLSNIKTIVVKVGTNLLSSKTGIDNDRIRNIADQVRTQHILRRDTTSRCRTT